MNLPNAKKPCDGKIKCPFRTDCLSGWIGEERIKEIIDGESFVCHKNHNLQCAGHLILKKEKNVFYQMAKRMGVNLNLKGFGLVFKTEQECINHHKN